MRLTLSIPCYGRPERTIRSINCIANQTVNGWEALVIGDGCPIMQDFIDSNYFLDIQKDCEARGNDLYISNNLINKGGHGYDITNINIQLAIEGTDLDFVYFDSFVAPRNATRIAELQYGRIGHSELIVRTDFLRQMPPHNEHYGHDWALIQSMMQNGKHKKALNCPQTYRVMSLSDNREKGID